MCLYSFDASENDLNQVFSGTFLKRENNAYVTTSVTGDFMVS